MGRPLNKRYFGEPTVAGNEIKVQFNNGNGSVPGYIVNQKGSKRFNVSNAGGTETGLCTLVDKASAALAAGEMSITVDDGGVAKQVTKISGRKVTLDDGTVKPWDFTGAGDTVAIEEAGTGIGAGVDATLGTADDTLDGADDTEGDG